MKVMLFVVYGNHPDLFLDTSKLVNLHHLKSMGGYGMIESSDPIPSSMVKNLEVEVWETIIKTGKTGLYLTSTHLGAHDQNLGEIFTTNWSQADPVMICQNQFKTADDWMKAHDWNACLIEDFGMQLLGDKQERDSYLQIIDEGLGTLFDNFDEETVVALFLRNGTVLNSFLLATPLVEPVGELLHASIKDLALILFSLLGIRSDENAEGHLIFERISTEDILNSRLEEDQEAILRERLSGLGYF